MQIDWARVTPVLMSMVIIALVAIARNYSRGLAVVLATMPINLPLAMYVIFDAHPEDQAGFSSFIGGLVVGLIPTMVFIVTAYAASRVGWTFWPVIGAGYSAWAVCFIVIWLVQRITAR